MADSMQIIDELRAIVGEAHVLTGDDVSSRTDDYPPITNTKALCIARPANTAEVSRILAYCHGADLKVVTQGGLTGLVGGAITAEGDIVLSLERMRSIEPVDINGGTVVVDAGVPLITLQEHARDSGLYYPVDLGARGSATIGGTIATNAGGNSVLRYGMTRDQLLGLEAVLADGTIISSMNRLMKNNTGVDLKQLFVGSEGTLGVVTRAVLRLRQDPGTKATAFFGLSSFDQVLALLRKASAGSDGTLTSFEVMWPSFVDAVLHDPRHSSPFEERHNFYVLAELVAQNPDDALMAIIEDAWNSGVISDAVIAQNLTQTESFWAIRDDIDALVAAMKPVFMYDISLPQDKMASYVHELEKGLTAGWPTARMAVFGHIGDGNLHIFITTGDAGDHHAVDELVYRPLEPIGGCISAEHGIGLEKRNYLSVSRSPTELALMASLKATLDPKNMLNPGKVLI